MQPPIIREILQLKQDAIFWQTAKWLEETKNDPHAYGNAVEKIGKLISKIPVEATRDLYLDTICQDHKISKKSLKGTITNERGRSYDDDEEDDQPRRPFPKWANVDETMKWGFAERIDGYNTGYYFYTGGGKLVKKTHFIVKPLYHIPHQDKAVNRRIFSVSNGLEPEDIIEIPSKEVLSLENFTSTLYSAGNYMQEAGFAKEHLIKILNKISSQFSIAYELEQLGWQHEGFFAFSDMVFKPGENGQDGVLSGYNQYGVAQVGDVFYLSSSFSKAHSKYRQTKDDHYKNDKYLAYKPAPIKFEQWCNLMVRAYKENSWMAIPFAIATLFRDAIMQVTKIPHLYGYGTVGSGKSEWGESILHLFFSGKDAKGSLYPAFNLAHGTEYAFWNGMERFINCPYLMNEFDENTIEDKRFRALKAAYDDEGRLKGSMDKKNKTTSQDVACTIILLGQNLGNKDNNAVLMRCLPLAFKVDHNRPDEQVAAFNELKSYEMRGLSGILAELLDLRSSVETEFKVVFSAVRIRLLTEFRRQNLLIPERILKNVSAMITTVELANRKFKLPYTNEEFYTYATNYAIKLADLVASTSGLSEFWSMVEHLLDLGMIEEGKEFEIASESSIKVAKDDGHEIKTFIPAKRLLYIRIPTVHKHYAEKFLRSNKNKSPLNEQTLLSYLKEQPYYVGWKKSHRAKKMVNSFYVFDYDALGINLERQLAPETSEIVIKGEILTDLTGVGTGDLYRFIVREYHKGGEKDGAKEPTTMLTYVCFTEDPAAVGQIQKGYTIQLKGLLSLVEQKNRTYRNVDVLEFEVKPHYRTFDTDMTNGQAANKNLPYSDVDPPF